MTKNIIYLMMFLSLLTGVYAGCWEDVGALTARIPIYYTFDTNLTLDNASETGWGDTVQQLLTPTSMLTTEGVYNNSAYADAATDGMNVQTTLVDNLARSQDFSFVFWYKNINAADQGTTIGQWGAGAEDTRWTFNFGASGGGLIFWGDGWFGTPPSSADLGWNMWAATWEEATNNVTIYRNFTQYTSDTTRTTGSNLLSEIGFFEDAFAGNNNQGGKVDHPFYYNGTLTKENLTCLWNITRQQELYPTGVTTPSANFTIQAKNERTSTLLLDFNASVDGILYKSNSTGAIVTHLFPNASSFYTVYVNGTLNNASYYPFVFNNWNVTSNMIANMTPFSLEFISQFPANNTQYSSTTVTINVTLTYNGTPKIQTCNLTLDSTLIYSIPSTSAENGTHTHNVTNYAITSGTHWYNWTCYNEFLSFTSNNTLFYIDTNYTTIATDFTNGTLYWKTNLTAQFNFTDDQSIYNYTIYVNGISINSSQDLSSTTFHQYNLSKNISSLKMGLNNMTVRVADGHTAQYIEPFDSIKIGSFGFKDYLLFNDDNTEVKIKGTSLTDIWSTTKSTDRYTFKYTPATKSSTHSFIVESNKPIYIMNNPRTQYKSWIITDNKWIDFKPRGINDFTISIKKLSDTRAEVTLGNIKTSTIEFESIGELNIATASYYFYVLNVTEQHEIDLIETQETTLNLTIDKTVSTFPSSAVLYYNGTLKIPTKTTIGAFDYYQVETTTGTIQNLSTNLSFYWVVNVNSTINQVYDTQNSSHLVSQIYLSNCTGAINITGINFTIYQEGTSTRLSSNVTALIRVWYNDPAYTRYFNFTYNDVNNFSICTYLSNNLSLNYEIEVKKDGYYTRRYNEVGKYINQVTQFINLYLLPTTASSVVTQIIDQVNNRLSNLTITMLRFDFPTSSHQIVQSEKSDINGNSLFYYDVNTKYQFMIYNVNGSLLYNTGDMIITQNPTIIKIAMGLNSDLVSKPLSAWQLKTNLYNISTVMYLEWITLNGAGTICLNVTYNNLTDWKYIYGNCSSSDSGILSYNFSSYTNGTIRGIAWIPGSSHTVNVLELALNSWRTFYSVIGKDGWIVYLLLMLAGAILGLTNVVTIPWILGAIHILSWIFGLIPVTYGLAGIPFLLALIFIMTRLK